MRFPFFRNRDSVKNGILISIRRTGDGFHPGLFTYLGFSSQSHLGKVFKKYTGMTMRQYREKYERNFGWKWIKAMHVWFKRGYTLITCIASVNFKFSQFPINFISVIYFHYLFTVICCSWTFFISSRGKFNIFETSSGVFPLMRAPRIIPSWRPCCIPLS